MSGFVCSSNIEYIDNGQTVSFDEEAAGKIGRVLGIVAAIFMPYAAPMIFHAVAGSGILGAGLAGAVASGTVGTLTNVIGSAVVGGILNAGIAYAGGARGAAVWQAAGMGALGGGIGGYARAPGAMASNIPTTPTSAPGGPTPLTVPAATGGAMPGASSLVQTTGQVTTGATAMSPSGILTNSIRSIFPNIGTSDIGRLGAVLINAAVNGQSMGRLDGLVAQQKAELDALKSTNAAAYQQKIMEAQKVLQDADRMDPEWWARVRMADVAGMEANQFKQAVRNIVTRQGGMYDAGQLKAYERSSALHTARSKALAWGTGYKDAFLAQNQLRQTGAGMLGPDEAGYQLWQAGAELDAAKERARREASNSTGGGFANLIAGENYPQATSPDPSNQGQNQMGNGSFGINPNIFSWGRNG